MTATAERPLVVMATDSKIPSGVGIHMLALARAIACDHRVVVGFPPIGSGAHFLQRADSAGLSVIPIESETVFGQWLKGVRAGILHVHAGIGWEGHGLAAVGRAAGVPVVRTEHLPYVLTDEAQRAEHRRGVETADGVIFVSEFAARSHRQAGVACGRTTTILNGIEPPCPVLAREETRRRLALPADAPVVVTVARFTAQKDYGLLLAASRQVLQAVPQARFLLVGDGPERAARQDMASQSGLGEAVLFLGERDDVPDLLAAADLFVLPSRFEGLPLAILEAMALRLPVVATRIGGTCEAVGGDYPWLVEPGDAGALAAAIIRALACEDERRRIGDRNRSRFEQYFRVERMGRETAAVYHCVASTKEQNL
ncbi:MAG TPA: glycosyltransferase [Xanthobacteraceae bacterium]|nr:glycosyltransferase [Xanthobacteraceae bacterium]